MLSGLKGWFQFIDGHSFLCPLLHPAGVETVLSSDVRKPIQAFLVRCLQKRFVLCLWQSDTMLRAARGSCQPLSTGLFSASGGEGLSSGVGPFPLPCLQSQSWLPGLPACVSAMPALAPCNLSTAAGDKLSLFWLFRVAFLWED